MGAVTTIRGVNETLAPTWNYLRTNDIEVRVPAELAVAAAPAPLERIPGGMGPEASDWLARAATTTDEVVVTSGVTPEAPVEITVEPGTGAVDDTLVTVCHDAEVTVVVCARTDEDAQATVGSRLRLDLGERARAHVFVYGAVSDASQFLCDMGVSLADDAAVDVRTFLLGGGLSAVGLRTENVGFRSRVTVDTRYVGMGDNVIDLSYDLRLRGRKSEARLDAYGILADRASKTLRDVIDLKRGCKGAEGNENETVLLAGKDVVNKSLPVILCDEDDVVGNHGATIGSISDEQFAYLRSRGLDEQDCKALFSRAVLDAAVVGAPTAVSREAALGVARRTLGEDAARDIQDLVREGE